MPENGGRRTHEAETVKEAKSTFGLRLNKNTDDQNIYSSFAKWILFYSFNLFSCRSHMCGSGSPQLKQQKSKHM